MSHLEEVQKNLSEDYWIPCLEVDGARQPHIVRYIIQKKLRPLTENRLSLFERYLNNGFLSYTWNKKKQKTLSPELAFELAYHKFTYWWIRQMLSADAATGYQNDNQRLPETQSIWNLVSGSIERRRMFDSGSRHAISAALPLPRLFVVLRRSAGSICRKPAIVHPARSAQTHGTSQDGRRRSPQIRQNHA